MTTGLCSMLTLISALAILVIFPEISRGQNLPEITPDLEEDIRRIFGTNPDNPQNVKPTSKPQVLEREGEQCLCVPYYLCDPSTKTINQDGSIDGFGVIDVRFNPSTCQDALDVCCAEGKRKPEPIVPRPPPAGSPTGCGIRNTNGIDFQIASKDNFESEFGEFPWTVAVLRNDDDKCQCGGSLIHPQVILTGAHCVVDIQPSGLRIRAGEWDTQTTKERLPYQERQVLRIISHEHFHPSTLYNDVSLLVLREPVQLAEHIQTICLPAQDYRPSAGERCVASGWGKKIFGQAGQYQVIMKRVELPVVPRWSCEGALRKTRLGARFNLHPSFMCAGGERGVDTCEGDGGAPLVCPIPGQDSRYQQCGIVAWGIGCGDDVPAVYADVAKFRDWIDEHMINLGFDTSSYVY